MTLWDAYCPDWEWRLPFKDLENGCTTTLSRIYSPWRASEKSKAWMAHLSSLVGSTTNFAFCGASPYISSTHITTRLPEKLLRWGLLFYRASYCRQICGIKSRTCALSASFPGPVNLQGRKLTISYALSSRS